MIINPIVSILRLNTSYLSDGQKAPVAAEKWLLTGAFYALIIRYPTQLPKALPHTLLFA